MNLQNLNQQGLNIVGVRKDKSPVSKWAHFQEGQQTLKDQTRIFQQSHGIGLICKDGVECIDVDIKYDITGNLKHALFKAFYEYLGEEIFLFGLNITKNNGFHFYYKVKGLDEGSKKLAMRYTTTAEQEINPHLKQMVLIETRGVKSYFVFPPTEGYYFDDEDLTIENFKIHEISMETRNRLHDICRSFNEVHPEKLIPSTSATKPQAQSGSNVIQDYNSKIDIEDVLNDLGFTFCKHSGANKHYTRAGKRHGTSAVVYAGENRVYNWSENSPLMEAQKNYNPFDIYVIREHAGDAKAAAKQLYKDGYGERLKAPLQTKKETTLAITSKDKEVKESVQDDDLLEKMFESRITIENKPPKIDFKFFYKELDQDIWEDSIEELGGYGELYTIKGLDKSGKTRLKNWLIQSALTHQYVNGFLVDIGKRNIIDLDTEQSKGDVWRNMGYILKDAGITRTPSNYYNFALGEHEMNDMLAFVEFSIEKVKDVGMLIIDGIVDLCADYNDSNISRELVGHLRKLAIKYNVMVFVILHNARSTGDARGHLGTEVKNKSKVVVDTMELMEEVMGSKTKKGTGIFNITFSNRRGGKPPKGFKYQIINNKIEIEN